jgi:putative Holliday junction resolvase
VGDDETCVATPVTTVEAEGPDGSYKAVADLVCLERPDRVIVGLPLSLDGTVGPQARLVQRFVRGLRRACNVPVITWDERLTSVEADRRMQEAKISTRRRKERRDMMAATLLLQAYLDAKASSPYADLSS